MTARELTGAHGFAVATGAIRWAAGPDGIAHAYRPRQPRSVCDWPRTDPRYERPAVEECAACRLALGLLPIGATPAKGA